MSFRAAALILVVMLAFSLGFITGVAFPLLSVEPVYPGVVWYAENVRTASANIAAVSADGKGLITTLTVEISPGIGRILVHTHPLVGFDFQYAHRTAVNVASILTGYALDDDGEGLKGADVLFSVSTRAGEAIEIQAIDGPSAGAAATVATVAALENKRVKEDVIITGTINPDGSVGPVGGIFEKASAVNELGAELFLVPYGQSVLTMYVEVVKQRGPFQWVTYEPVIVDLNEYAEEQGWGLEIREVSTIEEAIDLMLV